MVESQLRPNRIDDRRLLDAMGEVPRERFLPKLLRGVAYADEDLRLPGGGHLIEPLVLARLIQAGRVRPQDVVLVVGCTTGYAGAVLARMAATVILLQPDPGAAEQVERLLEELAVDNVVVATSADPAAGHPSQAPFDVILLVGAVEVVPPALLEQIGEGGRLVAVIDDGRVGKGTVFTRLHGVIGRQVMFDAQIPRLPGLARRVEFAFCRPRRPRAPPGPGRSRGRSSRAGRLGRPAAGRGALRPGRRARALGSSEICGFAEALHLPLGALGGREQELPGDRPLVVICHTGHRSLLATRHLRRLGLGEAVNLRGGVEAYALEVDSTMARY